MNLTDILLHLGEEDHFDGNPGSPALYQTSNFIFKDADSMRQALKREHEVPFYTRGTNPTVQKLATKLAALEGAADALVVASGSAAVATAVLANVSAGDHVLCVTKPYSWTAKLMGQLLPQFGVQTTLSDGKAADAFIQHVKDHTKIIFLESPNSWTFEMQDLEVITAFAKKRGILTIIDNSFATPLLQQPIKYGVDIIIHSATKYINGHSDVVAGVICGSREMIHKLFKSTYMTLGAAISPFDAWLMLRSLRTLPLRVRQISETATKVIAYLDKHPMVAKVYHPHSSHFDQSELTEKYLSGVGGLLTIDLATKEPAKIEAFANALRKFKLGCSWGSYESLAFPAITIADSLNYHNPDIVMERVRLSIGLDDADSLIADLGLALEQV